MNWRLLSALIIVTSVAVSGAHGAYVCPIQGNYLEFVASAAGAVSGADTTHPLGGELFGWSPGGEFKFRVYDSYAGGKLEGYRGDFVTFCAENVVGEYIDYGHIYRYESTLHSDAFTFADWIYYGYLTNQENYPNNPVPDRWLGSGNPLDSDAEAAKIQDALWWALGQTHYNWITAAEYSAWQAAYNADTHKDARIYEPQIAVLETVSGTAAQNQCVYLPREGGYIIPEPASLLIWSLLGLGSTGLAVWSRRRRGGFIEPGQAGWNPENREAILRLIEHGRRA